MKTISVNIINLICIVSFILPLKTGCSKKDTSQLLKIDVTKNYPEKKLFLQDIAEVSYIAIETNEDFLFSFIIGISESYIIAGNHVDNSFVFFDKKTGVPVSKIDRYGNGPEEYSLPAATVYSEKEDEFYILDYPVGIKVYTKEGTYKRGFPFRERSYLGGPESFYNYDKENLMFYDGFQGSVNDYPTAFVLISKQNGDITKEIEISYEEKINLMFTRKSDGQAIIGAMPKVHFGVRNGNDYLLTDYSTDTVYRYTPEQQLIPVLVREPSIQEMQAKIILHSWFETDKYMFFSTNKLEIDWGNPSEFPDKGLIIVKNTGNIYKSNVEMIDYRGKEIILGPSILSRSLKDTKTGFIPLSVSELMEANKEGKLTGKLKEVIEKTSDNEDYILMIMRFD